MGKVIDYRKEIFSRYGNVKRARNYYLYTEKGSRITDMFQLNGRSILGWRHGKSMELFKNIFDRGVLGGFKTSQDNQLEKAIKKLFPFAENFGIFTDSSLPCELEDFPLWRPWSSFEENQFSTLENNSYGGVKFYPPFPWGNITVVIFNKNSKVDPSLLKLCCENTNALPTPLKAAVTRSIYDLLSKLTKSSEKDFCLYDKILEPYFRREGIYLYPKCEEKEYNDLWIKALDNKILLSPNYNEPSIIPCGVNLGDIKLK